LEDLRRKEDTKKGGRSASQKPIRSDCVSLPLEKYPPKEKRPKKKKEKGFRDQTDREHLIFSTDGNIPHLAPHRRDANEQGGRGSVKRRMSKGGERGTEEAKDLGAEKGKGRSEKTIGRLTPRGRKT